VPPFRDSGLERFARRFDFLGGALKAKTAESQLGWFELPFWPSHFHRGAHSWLSWFTTITIVYDSYSPIGIFRWFLFNQLRTGWHHPAGVFCTAQPCVFGSLGASCDLRWRKSQRRRRCDSLYEVCKVNCISIEPVLSIGIRRMKFSGNVCLHETGFSPFCLMVSSVSSPTIRRENRIASVSW